VSKVPSKHKRDKAEQSGKSLDSMNINGTDNVLLHDQLMAGVDDSTHIPAIVEHMISWGCSSDTVARMTAKGKIIDKPIK